MGITCETSNLRKLINKVERMDGRIEAGCEKLINELTKIGEDTANGKISSAYVDVGFDGYRLVPDISVYSSVTKTGEGTVGTVTAYGTDAPFVEFGAGVRINSNREYPGTIPDEIVGLGQYGKGYGNRRAWGFYMVEGDPESLYLTLGTPMQHPMYDTAKEMRRTLSKKSRIKELMGL